MENNDFEWKNLTWTYTLNGFANICFARLRKKHKKKIEILKGQFEKKEIFSITY